MSSFLYRVPEGWWHKAVTVKQKSWLLTNLKHASNMILLNNIIILPPATAILYLTTCLSMELKVASTGGITGASLKKQRIIKPETLTCFGWTNWCGLQSGTNGNNYQLQLQFQTRTNGGKLSRTGEGALLFMVKLSLSALLLNLNLYWIRSTTKILDSESVAS